MFIFVILAAQLEAIERTKVNVSVYLGNYNVPTDGGASYTRQRDTIKEALQTYGTDHVLGVTVGNEWMLKCVFTSPAHSHYTDMRPASQIAGSTRTRRVIPRTATSATPAHSCSSRTSPTRAT